MVLSLWDKRTTLIPGEMLFLGGDRQHRRVFFPTLIAFSGYLIFLFLVTKLPFPSLKL